MTDKLNITQLETGLNQLHLDLTQEMKQKLLQYIELLYKWNKTYNLTALRDKAAMLSHHLFDSLSILPFIASANSLLDVGSGAGVPGILIAIVRPDMKVMLVDSNGKKSTFLAQAAIELQLPNVVVKQARIEALHGFKYEVIISRAFSELIDFVALTKHLLAENGYWLAMKGIYPYEEISKLPKTSLLTEVHEINVPEVKADRHVVIMTVKKD